MRNFCVKVTICFVKKPVQKRMPIPTFRKKNAAKKAASGLLELSADRYRGEVEYSGAVLRFWRNRYGVLALGKTRRDLLKFDIVAPASGERGVNGAYDLAVYGYVGKAAVGGHFSVENTDIRALEFKFNARVVRKLPIA